MSDCCAYSRFFCAASLSPSQLDSVAKHAYKPGVYTPLDYLLYRVWWNKVTDWLPLWLAPNVITFTGFLLSLVSSLVLISYCPTFTEEAPRWVYFQFAFFLFVYQTLDAVDGKQARRTNSSSPMGQLFDHGCDCVLSIFMILGLFCCMQLNKTISAEVPFVIVFIGQVVFLVAQVEENLTGILNTCAGWIGVTEAQASLMLIAVVTGIVGPQVWDLRIPGGFKLLTLKQCLLIVAMIGCLLYIASMLLRILSKNWSKNTFPLLEFTVSNAVLCVCVWIFVKAGVADYGVLPCLVFGVAIVYSSLRVIVSTMSNSPMPVFFLGAHGPLLIASIGVHLNLFTSSMCIYKTLVAVCAWETFHIIMFSSRTLWQISSHLGLKVFRIPYPQKPKDN